MGGHRLVITYGIGFITLVLVLTFFRSKNGEYISTGLIGDTVGDIGVTSGVSPTVSPSKLVSPTMSPTVSPSLSPLISSVLAPLKSILSSPTTISPNPTVKVSSNPTPTAVSDPNESDLELVVINEVGWMGTKSSQYAEWIELYNPSTESINLSGWTIFESGGNTKVISLDGTIPARGYFLIERITPSSPDAIVDITADIQGSFGGSGLKDGGEHLTLVTKTAQVIDSVETWYAGGKETHSSMERIDANKPGNQASNWQTNNGQKMTGQDAGGNPIRGTPRNKNSVAAP